MRSDTYAESLGELVRRVEVHAADVHAAKAGILSHIGARAAPTSRRAAARALHSGAA